MLLQVLSGLAPLLLPLAPGDGIRYGRDVRPILSDRCFQCHGTDAAERRADLRLDTPEGALADLGGTAAVVPGDVEGSELWRRITSHDPDEVMPPPGSNRRPLTAEEREVLRRWIEAGAPYEEHWAFVPPVRPELPAGAAHPVDAFVDRALAGQGLEAVGPLEPGPALRRLFLDLTGLPPTPEELEAHLAELETDDPDEVWERWIERLFSEEPYRTRHAERMASPWLDQARYADTNGIHMDAGRQMWLWRDWVIEAYRDNKPFDEFVVEQLAGDLLPDATLEQVVASGFNRNHVITDEGGAIDAEYLVEYAADRVDTTASVFLGLTMRCARCHDHKFDPITQEDYYRLFDFFHSNDEVGLYSQQPNPRRAFEPAIAVPTEEQAERRQQLEEERVELRERLESPGPEELAAVDAELERVLADLAVERAELRVVSAASEGGATLTVLEDGSVLASGENPGQDVHRLVLRTEARGLQLLQLDALAHASLPGGKPGRAPNGNAVLTGFEVQAVSLADPSVQRTLRFRWLWASREQENGPFNLEGALDADPASVWAIRGYDREGDASALFLCDEPFGYEGGTELRVRLGYESVYTQHTFGRVRLGAAAMDSDALASLPLKQGRWYHAGPFSVAAGEAYGADFGPEHDAELDRGLVWKDGEADRRWTFQERYLDETLVSLPAGTNVHYVAKEVWSATAREVEVSLGSDDGFALFVNGVQAAAREVARGVAPEQDRATVSLRAGRNVLCLKVVNTGGAAGFWFRAEPDEARLPGPVAGALVDPALLADEGAALRSMARDAVRRARSPEYVAGLARLEAITAELAELDAAVPRTMVMRERTERRPTFVLMRGEYDKPDTERPVTGDVPEVFGRLELGEEATRLDLARWMVAPDNPLVARVAVNRLWQMIFGRGLVATSGDLGFQGDWPSHPDLLDWLAVEFVESGWDVRHVLRTIVTSEAYRRSSHTTEALLAADPDNRWLARFPRRRLDAERLRDQALHVSGLLVEELGGESVKPYQPEGLWREVAMVQSNTRAFERGMGADLWRRSLYTYWKRACPPPTMLVFDAPTRESCVVERSVTNTPLQALALWNDEQFLEAARVLAERTLADGEDDRERLERLFLRCTARRPTAAELALLEGTLAAERERYAAAPQDALGLAEVGEAPRDGALAPEEVAAWTLVASAVLNLHATLTNG